MSLGINQFTLFLIVFLFVSFCFDISFVETTLIVPKKVNLNLSFLNTFNKTQLIGSIVIKPVIITCNWENLWITASLILIITKLSPPVLLGKITKAALENINFILIKLSTNLLLIYKLRKKGHDDRKYLCDINNHHELVQQ